MQQIDEQTLRSILGEVIADELKVIHEYLESLLPLPDQVRQLDDRLKNVEADIKVIKAVITDHSYILQGHEQRLTLLESG
jgi:hypothetical protein